MLAPRYSAKNAGCSVEEALMDDGTRLAYERTILAQERTLMAWLRTAVSLITFGFTLYKFFALELGAKAGSRAYQVIGPRQFAIIMIAIGLFALVVATLQNIQNRKSIRKEYPKARLSLSSLVAAMISALGLLAMAAVLFRW
jgi:inner membrane protein YidH